MINKQHAMNQQFEEDLAVKKSKNVQMIAPWVLRAVAHRIASNDEDAAVIRAVASGQEDDSVRNSLIAMLLQEMFFFTWADLFQMAQTINKFAGQEINNDDLNAVANAFGCFRSEHSDILAAQGTGTDKYASRAIAGAAAVLNKRKETHPTHDDDIDAIVRQNPLISTVPKDEEKQSQEQHRASAANATKSNAGEVLAGNSPVPHSNDSMVFTSPTRVKMTEIDDGLEPPPSSKPSLALFDDVTCDGETTDEQPGQVINNSQEPKVRDELSADVGTKDQVAEPPVTRKKKKSAPSKAQGIHAGKPSSGQKRARDDSSEGSLKSSDTAPRKGKKLREDSELTQRNQKFIESVEKEIRRGRLDVLTLDCGHCQSEAVDPRVTNCNHIYCMKCVKEIQNGMQRAEASKVGCTHSGCDKKIGKVGIVSPGIIDQLKQKHARFNSDSDNANNDESRTIMVDEA